jgi:DNA-directed RNA polymerase subunit K/omega
MFKEKLNQIKVILGLEVKLASEKLVDGTVIEAETFEPGFPLFVISEDGTKSPAPAGIHETESGDKVEVDQEGKIVSIAKKEIKDAKVEIEVEAAAEDSVPASETQEEIAKKEASVNEALKKMVMAVEEIAKDVAEVKKDVAETKTEMASMKSKYEKFSKIPGGNKAPQVTRGEFEAISPLEAKIAALNQLKNENFFKK